MRLRFHAALRLAAWLGLLTTLAFVSRPAAAGSGCVWGSFDGSRINYAGGELTGSAHTVLQGIITTNGGTLAPGTPTLTPAYLSGVNVFYTSLLSTSTGALSAAEQSALFSWVQAGGTLIVTADIFPLAAYATFTTPFAVTTYTALGFSSFGAPTASHPITLGVVSYQYATNSTFNVPGNSQVLGNDGYGNNFILVMEPATGFILGGRVVIFGDHNMFTNTYIGTANNTILADNLVKWACGSLVTPTKPHTWGALKALYR